MLRFLKLYRNSFRVIKMTKKQVLLAVFLILIETGLCVYLTSQYLKPETVTRVRLDTSAASDFLSSGSSPAGKEKEVRGKITYTLVTGDEPAGTPVTPTGYEASGSLEQHGDPDSNTPDKAIDDDLFTSWQENQEDGGIGAYIQYSFDRAIELSTLVIYAGVWNEVNGESYFEKDNRPKKLAIDMDGKSIDLKLEDSKEAVTLKFDTPVTARKIRFTIKEIYAGSDYNDTGISEIRFYERTA